MSSVSIIFQVFNKCQVCQVFLLKNVYFLALGEKNKRKPEWKSKIFKSDFSGTLNINIICNFLIF